MSKDEVRSRGAPPPLAPGSLIASPDREGGEPPLGANSQARMREAAGRSGIRSSVRGARAVRRVVGAYGNTPLRRWATDAPTPAHFALRRSQFPPAYRVPPTGAYRNTPLRRWANDAPTPGRELSCSAGLANVRVMAIPRPYGRGSLIAPGRAKRGAPPLRRSKFPPRPAILSPRAHGLPPTPYPGCFTRASNRNLRVSP